MEVELMKRRDFITLTGGAATLLKGSPPFLKGTKGDWPEFQLALSQATLRVDGVLKTQVIAGEDRYRGGFIAPTYGFPFPSLNAVELKNLGALFCHQDSVYYHHSMLGGRIDLALGWLEREQHPDGTVDLPTTNFHSPPDTAFVVLDLVLFYRILQQDGSPEAYRWRLRLEKFLHRAATAITTGGIHTPNHRWVASAALAGCYSLFHESTWLSRIEAWLGEGIDCNVDGEYNELSNAIYNPISNRALLTMAEALDRPELLAPVRRNLTMMLYCIHPDGEIVTDYSRRQDKLQRAWPANYYLHYRVLGAVDGDGRMAAMADRIAEASRRHPERVPIYGELTELMLRPELKSDKIARLPLPDEYKLHFRQSDVVRLCRGKLSATIVGRSSRFLSVRYGDAVIEAVRLASAFFGKGQFVGQRIEQEGIAYVLRQELEAAYYLPFPPGPNLPQPDWDRLDRNLRGRSHQCRLRTEVRLTPIERGFELEVRVEGTDRVPVALELWFRPGGELKPSPSGRLLEANGSNFLTAGEAHYKVSEAGWVVGPGTDGHRWASLRGAEPPLENARPVTITGFTPYHHRFKLVAVI